ncbi:MAG: hypothetical protein K5892_04595 [Acholeplasmatales bacterium]|nr:hypothetical protein [Acholeplasmatales bacterium]
MKEAKAVKIYKPEILECPKCGYKLEYAYTVSNKVIQFSSGRIFRIKNRGYKCPLCNDNNIYISQTGNKLAFKGYTYSTKVVCMIENYKSLHVSRDMICDLLVSKGIEISDRNIDILYKKIRGYMDIDYDARIKEEYKKMLDEFNEIRISFDLISVDNKYYAILYNFFSSELICVFKVDSYEDESFIKMLSNYINDKYNITYIVTIRPFFKFYSILKKMAPNETKFVSFHKF